MPDEPLRILVVDDTVVYRRILSDVVADLDGAELAGTAAHGRLALTKLQHTAVDLVLLDVEMPELNGLETLALIREKYPDMGVVMVSGANQGAARNTVAALEKGALDFINKPEADSPEASRRQIVEQLRPLLRIFRTRRNLRGKPEKAVEPEPPRPTLRTPVAAPPERMAPAPSRIDVVAVGVSTGGPNALATFLSGLPGTIGVPMLIVQHMPPVFTASLAEHLNRKSALTVREACENEAIQPDTVYIAPGGKHMVIRAEGEGTQKHKCIGLNTNPPENSCRPAVDVLFRSVAAHYCGNILAVVLTGMGADGREGVRAMKRAGCYCITQDETSCVVYGMPQSVVAAGLSDEQVSISGMAERVLHKLNRR